jgi:hypothetical protein
MADYIISKVSEAVEAKAVDGKTIPARPAVYELNLLMKAIDESGKEVQVRGQRMQLTEVQLDQRIAALEAETSKWKAIKADMLK